jgi:P4 family phage/plasmid primase-like protien
MSVVLREQRKEDYCTKQTTVDADLRADCALWKAFLLRIMDDDQSMVDYLQRVCGYCLTGLVDEHVMFFGHGTGANGKGTFAGVLTGILGTGPTGYAAVAPISTFTASKTEQHPTDLAMLQGVRLVIAQETEEGRSWAVAKIKMMTGGDLITARFMRQDFFTYRPQFKIMILGNHKPALHNIDEATRRRIHLIPFTVTIPKAERDLKLPEKLTAEYPHILGWMMHGFEVWSRIGLAPPAKVLAASAAYFADEDTIAAWIAERCDVGKALYDTLVALFPCWKAWAEARGERVGSSKELAKALDTRPELTRHNDPATRRAGWHGLMVKPQAPRWEMP